MSTLFTRIIAGEIPGRFVHSDDVSVAFLSIEPLQPGHTLVVPRTEVDRWTDLPEELTTHLFAVAHRIGRAQLAVFGGERAGLMIQGYEIPHVHLHVWPSRSPADFSFAHAQKDVAAEDLDTAAQALRAELET